MRIVLTLALLLVTAVAVAWIAKIDIVAPTRGEVVARQRTREVRALETGMIAVLHVEEGSRVRRGVPIVDLDDAIVASEIRRIEAELGAARRTVRRLRLLAAGSGVGSGVGAGDAAPYACRGEHPSCATEGEGWPAHLRLVDLERRRLAAALAEADREIEARRLRQAAVAAERRLVERQLPVLRERVDGLAALSARSHASRHDYLHELSRRIEMEGRGSRSRSMRGGKRRRSLVWKRPGGFCASSTRPRGSATSWTWTCGSSSFARTSFRPSGVVSGTASRPRWTGSCRAWESWPKAASFSAATG